jgi:hypothetical protein
MWRESLFGESIDRHAHQLYSLRILNIFLIVIVISSGVMLSITQDVLDCRYYLKVVDSREFSYPARKSKVKYRQMPAHEIFRRHAHK